MINTREHRAGDHHVPAPQIPNGTTTYNRFYTGDLKLDAKDNSLVPDFASGKPNLQTSGWSGPSPRPATTRRWT